MQWFVEPKIVRLDLPDGQWLDVKRELTQGEEDEIAEASVQREEEGRSFVRPGPFWRARILAYVTEWSLPGSLDVDTLKAMTPEGFAAIRDAIDQHESRVSAEKNAPTTPA